MTMLSDPELPGVIVKRIRHPAAAVGGDPFRSAPAVVPDTVSRSCWRRRSGP
jgi:hypothetical protein